MRVLLLAVLSAWLLFTATRDFPNQLGMDLYHPWGIERVREAQPRVANPYVDPVHYGRVLFDQAYAGRDASRKLWVTANAWRGRSDVMFEPTGTPLFYALLSWLPRSYDRTHLLNLVVGVPLRRNWDLGMRAQYESGEPATTTYGYNTARNEGYLRFDVRVDKRAVYRSWLLDFYVDITNVALLPEQVTPGQTIRYVFPTVGLRARI